MRIAHNLNRGMPSAGHDRDRKHVHRTNKIQVLGLVTVNDSHLFKTIQEATAVPETLVQDMQFRLRLIDGYEQAIAVVYFNVAPKSTRDVQPEKVPMSGGKRRKPSAIPPQ